MKANELMIGDLLYDKANDYYGEVTGVIDNGEIYIDGVIAYIADCTPIPLTQEILEKNRAFKNHLMGEQRHFTYNLYGFELLAIYDADFSFQINTGARKMKYVHELQHALKLCGIEKTIEL